MGDDLPDDLPDMPSSGPPVLQYASKPKLALDWSPAPSTAPTEEGLTGRDEAKSSSPSSLQIERLEDGTKIVNSFRIESVLGRGGFGKVSKGVHQQTKQEVAIKKLSRKLLAKKVVGHASTPSGVKTLTMIDQVQTEIDIVRRLDHPNIVKLLHVWDDPTSDSLYLVFEFAAKKEVMKWDGTSQIYKSEAFPTHAAGGVGESVAFKVFSAALSALEYLHSQRIAHRDIKPENLLLFEDDSVRLTDFGVAQRFVESQSPLVTDSNGTYPFFCPEACQGKFSAFCADLWALHVTLFALVFGKVPWFSDNTQDLFDEIITANLVFPATRELVRPSLLDLLRSSLHKDIKRRPTIPQIKEHPWFQEMSSNSSL